jgi:hypothetical protein
VMTKSCLTASVDSAKLRQWLLLINPYFLAIREPKFFIEMGIPAPVVQACTRKHRHLCLGNGKMGNAIGVSDIAMLLLITNGIGVDISEGNRFLCTSNKIEAWKEACLVKLNEIEQSTIGRHQS